MRQYGFSLTQENCRSGHIYWRNLNEKLHFLCSVTCRCRLNVIMTYGASFTKAWTRGRSRNWRCSIKKAGFKNFAIFLETPVLELCCKFMKKWFQHEFFLWILQKFLRTSTLKNICWRLLLQRATHLLFYVVFYMFKDSHPEVFLGKDVLNICSKFTGEHPCRSAISIKLLCNFIEIVLRHRCSLVNLLHISRTSFLKSTSGWLLLNVTFIVNFSWMGWDLNFFEWKVRNWFHLCDTNRHFTSLF